MGEWKSLKIDSGTGWKEIYREAGSGWKALDWEGVPIDVGCACTNRDSNDSPGYTHFTKFNPANANGTITNVCIWFVGAVTSGKIYILENTSGNNFKCKAIHTFGMYSAGEQNISVSLPINIGEYIGYYTVLSGIDRSQEGTAYYYYRLGTLALNSTYLFTQAADYYQSSCYGTG